MVTAAVGEAAVGAAAVSAAAVDAVAAAVVAGLSESRESVWLNSFPITITSPFHFLFSLENESAREPARDESGQA